MGVGIPASIEDVTPAWLTAATGLAVEAAQIEQIGVGIGVSSALYRARLTGPGCPATVVVKLPALDEAAVFTSTVFSMYLREARFFAELADRVTMRVPVLPRARRRRDQPLRRGHGGPRRLALRRPDPRHVRRRRRAGRGRAGVLARDLVGPGRRTGRSRDRASAWAIRSTPPSCRWCSARAGRSCTTRGSTSRRPSRRSAGASPTRSRASSPTWPPSRPR